MRHHRTFPQIVTTTLFVGLLGACAERESLVGVVRTSPCFGDSGVRVSALGASAEVISGEDGSFALPDAPRDAEILVRAPGFVPTLTSGVRAPDGLREAALIPRDFFDLVVGLAGFVVQPGSGYVVVVAQTAQKIPVSGLHFELRDENGVQPIRRYFGFNGAIPSFRDDDSGSSTDEPLAGFLDVPPGTYELQTLTNTRVLESRSLTVLAGTATVAQVEVEDVGEPFPSMLSGGIAIISAQDFSLLGEPLADATIVVESPALETPAMTQTDADGQYRLMLPFFREPVSVRYEHGDFVSTQSEEFCFGERLGYSISARDHFSVEQQVLKATGTTTPDPMSGVVEILPFVAGATVEIVPPVATAFYGEENATWSDTGCAHEACDPDGQCPAGRRCQEGECVLGTNGPLCERIAFDADCPNDHMPWFMGSPVDDGSRLYCVPLREQCSGAGEGCPSGTYCRTLTDTSGTQRVLEESFCEPYRPLRNSVTNGSGAWFANVPEGTYIAMARHPDPQREFRPVRFSVRAGTFTRLGLEETP